MGLLKELFCGGVTRDDLKADFIRWRADVPDRTKSFDASPRAAVACVEGPSGKWLLIESTAKDDRSGLWCFPGGGIEAGEGPEAAAARECLEETGVACQPAGMALPLRDQPDVSYVHCVAGTSNPPIADPREATDARWLSLDEMSRLPLYSNVLDTIIRIRRAGMKAFDDSQHPRGQPGNAGQFGPGGGHSPPSSHPAPTPHQAPAKPAPHQVAEAVADRVASKVGTNKPINHTDQAAIANAVRHLDRKQLDWLIAKIGLPAVPSNGGGRAAAILNAVAAHATAKPHPAPINGGHVDVATAPPVDYSGQSAAKIPGWERMEETDPKMRSYGAVLMRADPTSGKPQVMLREPTGHYGGFAWTFPQGRPDSGADHPVDVAHRECGEETGLSGHVIGHIPQTFGQVFRYGDHIENAYFLMRHDGGAPDIRKLDDETNDAKWVDLDQAHKLIEQSTNQAGRDRDLKVLDAVRQMAGGQSAGPAQGKGWEEDKHPRAGDGKFGHGGGSHSHGEGGKEEARDHGHAAAADDYKKNGTRSKAFKSWFGEWEHDPESASKVVDETGEPQEQHGTAKKVFHGTHAEFDSFDKGKARSGAVGTGFYFAEDRGIAEEFSDSEHGRIIDAYLNIRRPFSFEEPVTPEQMEAILGAAKKTVPEAFDANSEIGKYAEEDFNRRAQEKGNLTGYDARRILSQAVPAHYGQDGDWEDRTNDVLASLGYDGIVHGSRDAAGTPSKPGEKARTGRVWIAFEPTQIKTTGNRGTFDPKDPHMGKAFSPLVEKGFTGTVTASNGVIFHYVDGKRVAGPQQYQAHLSANPHAAPPPGPGAAASNPAAARQAVADAANKLKTGSATLTNQEIGDLVHHFQHLTLAETQLVKVQLGLPKMRGIGGGKNLADHVAQILDYVITHPMTQGSANAPAPAPAAPVAPAPAPSLPPAATATATPFPPSAASAIQNATDLNGLLSVLSQFKGDHTNATIAVRAYMSYSQSGIVAQHLGIPPADHGSGRTNSDVDDDIIKAVAKGVAVAQSPPAAAPPAPTAPAPAPASHLHDVHKVLSDIKAGNTPTAADIQAAANALGSLTNFQIMSAASFAGVNTQGSTRSEVAGDLLAHMQGFTGTVTASNGVVYHYQNGVRVAGPQTPAPGAMSPVVVSGLLQKFQAGGPLTGQYLKDLQAHLPSLSDSGIDSVATRLGLGTVAQTNRAHVEASVEAHMAGQPAPAPPVNHMQTAINAIAGQPAAIQNAMDSAHSLQGHALGQMRSALGLTSTASVDEVRDALAKHLQFHGTTVDGSGLTIAYVHGSPLVLKTSHPIITPILQRMLTGQAISPAEQAAFNAAVIGGGFNRKQLDDMIADMGLPPTAPGAGGRTSALIGGMAGYTGSTIAAPAAATPPAPPPAPMAPVVSSLGPTPIPPLPTPPPGPPAFAVSGAPPTNVNATAAHRGKLMLLVQHHLTQTGQTAEQVVNSGSSGSVRRAIASGFSARNAPSNFDVDRAIKSAMALEATSVLPPLFQGNSSRNGPNHALPVDARPAMGTAEKVAVQKYTVNPISWAINDALRTTGKPPADLADLHHDLQASFAKATPFATPVVCNREMTLSKVAAANLVKLATAAQAGGGALMMPGYTSTTVGHAANSFFQGNVRLVINATHGLDMDPVSHYPGANELLLNHASQFKVTRVSTVGGKTEIHLDQIPPDQASPMAAHDQAPAGVSAWGKGVWAKKAKGAKAATAPAAGVFKKFSKPQDSAAVMDYITGKTSHRLHHNSAGAGEDTLLTPIMNDNGKSALPQLLDRAGIDALKAQGWTIGHRGVQGKAFTDQFKSDPNMWNGAGMYGNGTYVCFSDGGHMSGRSGGKGLDETDTARHAGGSYGPDIMRIAIPPTAKKITAKAVAAKRRGVEKQIDADVAAGSLTHSQGRKLKEVCHDNGRLAALLGYDVIVAGGSSYNYCVVLNRAILAVQRSNV